MTYRSLSFADTERSVIDDDPSIYVEFNVNILIGKVLDKKYLIKEFIARGSQSNVFLAIDIETEELVGMKIMRRYVDQEKQKISEKNFKTEIGIHRYVNDRHRNLARLLDTGSLVEISGSYMYMILEYYPTDLFEEINVLEVGPSDQKFAYINDICNGISFLHEQKIYHRDLKPENIFLKGNGTCVIGDFGYSIPYNIHNQVAGTFVYMSPENYSTFISLKKGNYHVIPPSPLLGDIWSLGVLFINLFFFDMPWEIPCRKKDDRYKIFYENPDLYLDSYFPRMEEKYRNIFKKCFHINPKKRYSSVEKMLDDINSTRFERPKKKSFLRNLFSDVQSDDQTDRHFSEPANMIHVTEKILNEYN